MATIGQYMLGRQNVSVTLYPQTIGTSGILADASTKAITGFLDSFSLNLTPTKENISAVNSPRANNVVIEDDFSGSFSVIKKHDASDPNILATIVLTNDVFKCIVVNGTTTGSVETWTFFMVRGNLTDGINGKGKQVSTLEFSAVDTGTGGAGTAWITRGVA